MNEESADFIRKIRSKQTAYMGVVVGFVLVGLGIAALSVPFWSSPSPSRSDAGFSVLHQTAPSTKPRPMPSVTAVPTAPYSVRGPSVSILPTPSPEPPKNVDSGGERGADSKNAVETPARESRDFKQAVAANRLVYKGVRDRYLERSPVVRKFFDEWRSAPDLKKLTDEWNQNHDVLKFAWGAVNSPNFAALIQRYSPQTDFRSFMIDMAASSPKDVIASWNSYSQNSDEAKQLAAHFLHSSGLPVSLAQSISSGKMDPNQMAAQILASAPALPPGFSLPQQPPVNK